MRMKFFKTLLPIFAALAVVFGIYMAVSTSGTEASGNVDYTVTYVKVSNTSSASAVKNSTKVAASSPSVVFTVQAPSNATNETILIAAQTKSNGAHTQLNSSQRHIDVDGNVHRFRKGKNDYWLIERGTTSSVPDASLCDITFSSTNVQLGCTGSCNTIARVRNAARVELDASEYRFTTVNVTDYIEKRRALGLRPLSYVLDASADNNVYVKQINQYDGGHDNYHIIERGFSTYHTFPDENVVTYVPGESITYAVEHKQIDGTRDSKQAVLGATQTNGKYYDSIYNEATLSGTSHTWCEVAVALRLSGGSRVIDETDTNNKRVINFARGKNTYLVVTVKNGTIIPPTITPTPTPVVQSVTYIREHMQIDGARDTEQAVLDATQTNGKHYNDIYLEATLLGASHTWSQISTALGLNQSRIIDETDLDNKRVLNFHSGKNTYLVVTVKGDTPVTPTPTTVPTVTPPTPIPTTTPAPTGSVTYIKEHMQIDGTRDSEQAVLDATQTNGKHYDELYMEVTLNGTSHTWSQISTALGLDGSRVIDETDPNNKRVLNFQNGKNTYLVVTIKGDTPVTPTPTPTPVTPTPTPTPVTPTPTVTPPTPVPTPTPPTQTTTVTYLIEHKTIDGTLDSEQAVLDATQTNSPLYDETYKVMTLAGSSHSWYDLSYILRIRDSRVINEIDPDNKSVWNFKSGKNTYLVLSIKTDDVHPVNSVTYSMEHMEIDGNMDSEQAVLDATQTKSDNYNDAYREVTIVGTSHPYCRITTQLYLGQGTRVIDETDADNRRVVNFSSGADTYLVIKVKNTTTVTTPSTNSVTYTKGVIQLYGDTSSEQAVLNADSKCSTQYHAYYTEATLEGTSHTWDELVSALNIGPYARVIDATDPNNRRVVGFRDDFHLYYVVSIKE